MEPQKKAKIFFVDDHPIVRQGLAQLINQQHDMEVCGEAEDAVTANQWINHQLPDAVIVDISLKGSDGLELTKSIRGSHPSMAILVLSMHDESIYAERALRAGANGYIMKQAATENFLLALRRVLTGGVYLSDAAGLQIVRGIVQSANAVTKSPVERLSDRELEVFRWVGDGLGPREIASRLNLSVKTVETHLARIKEKVAVRSYRELIRHAVQWCEREGS